LDVHACRHFPGLLFLASGLRLPGQYFYRLGSLVNLQHCWSTECWRFWSSISMPVV